MLNKNDMADEELIASGDKNLTKRAVHSRAAASEARGAIVQRRYQSAGSVNSGFVNAARWWSRQAPSMKR